MTTKSFVTNADIWMEGRKRKLLGEGKIECSKHKDIYYDPKKFKQCYKCFNESSHTY